MACVAAEARSGTQSIIKTSTRWLVDADWFYMYPIKSSTMTITRISPKPPLG
jgi:hypothetical protein